MSKYTLLFSEGLLSFLAIKIKLMKGWVILCDFFNNILSASSCLFLWCIYVTVAARLDQVMGESMPGWFWAIGE